MYNLNKISNVLYSISKFTKKRFFQTCLSMNKSQSGRYKITNKRSRPLTYEMAKPPYEIAHKKSWNSWNTSNIINGNRPMECAVEDLFIRKFLTGTWCTLFLSEIIIKRNHNMIRIAGVVKKSYDPIKYYFLIGYTEELLSYYLHCPVKLELQSAMNEDIIFKYI